MQAGWWLVVDFIRDQEAHEAKKINSNDVKNLDRLAANFRTILIIVAVSGVSKQWPRNISAKNGRSPKYSPNVNKHSTTKPIGKNTMNLMPCRDFANSTKESRDLPQTKLANR